MLVSPVHFPFLSSHVRVPERVERIAFEAQLVQLKKLNSSSLDEIRVRHAAVERDAKEEAANRARERQAEVVPVFCLYLLFFPSSGVLVRSNVCCLAQTDWVRERHSSELSALKQLASSALAEVERARERHTAQVSGQFDHDTVCFEFFFFT